MEVVVNQIHTLSTKNDSDLKKLKDYLRHEAETLKANAAQLDSTLTLLDPAQHTLGVAFLLAAQLAAGVFADEAQTFTYVGNFLRVGDETQMKKGSVPVNAVVKCYAKMAISKGQQAMMRSLQPLQIALEKLRPTAETVTPAHAEFLRVCLSAKAYHLGARVLDQPIFDIDLSNPNCPQMTPRCFLSYFYYGGMIRIGMKQYAQAMQLLLVALTCPASCLSAIQADAYKKFVLVSLKLHGELHALPVYTPLIVQRYAKSAGYVLDLAEAYKQGSLEGLQRVLEEKAQAIQADQNTGLVKQVISSLQRHKVKMLTNTYLTLSLAEIAKEIGLGEAATLQVEDLLLDMISGGEIRARIDQTTGNVSFEDEQEDMDVAMVGKMQGTLQKIMAVAARISAFEQEISCSEAYIRKTAALEGGASAGPALGTYDFMDM